MVLHETPMLPRGFTCVGAHCGLKETGDDLALVVSETEAAAAAVFTKNQFPGAPVIVGREIIRDGRLHAIVVNSRVSNVGTGPEGSVHARRMAAAVATEFGIPENRVIMSSTGVIGRPLPIEKIEAGIVGLAGRMTRDPLAAARGIMTTDTYPKAISMNVGEAVLTLIGKGAGMIEPNMATMLVYILTDAALAPDRLDALLRQAVDVSFNMLSVDTDTSTSDTCVVLANGLAGPLPEAEFGAALTFGCIEMAKRLARDGEGATKLLIGRVDHAADRTEARTIAKSLVNSPLIKTMAYGADPNIGRVLMAVGKCIGCAMAMERIRIRINDHLVFADGARVDFDEARVRRLLSSEVVEIEVNLGMGEGRAEAYGCDLTEGYIKENAAYYSS